MIPHQNGTEVNILPQGTGGVGPFLEDDPALVEDSMSSLSSLEMNLWSDGESVTKATHRKHQTTASPPWR